MRQVNCMLCESGKESDLDDPRLAAELKVDGTRGWLGKEDDDTFWIFNRKQVNYTDRLPEILEAMKVIPAGDFIIDGEIVVYDEQGRTWFEGSQRRCSTQDPAKQKLYRAKYPVVALSFDLISLDGKSLENWGYEKRKAMLLDLLKETPQTNINYLPSTVMKKRELFDGAVAKGEEGVIAKQLGSPYVGKRSRFWLKVKKWYPERCRVVGYTDGSGKRDGLFGSLILAQPDDEDVLRYVGKVGTGFNDAELKKVAMLLFDAEVDSPLVDARNANGKLVPHTPTAIDLEVTVKFYETSKRGVFRFPSLLKDDYGNNLIHWGADTLGGTVNPKQMDLKKLLESISR